MKEIVTTGRTVEEAVAAALETLGVEPGAVEVEVLEEGAKGIFGLGQKQARVRAVVKDARGAGRGTVERAAVTSTAGETAEGAVTAGQVEKATTFLRELLSKLEAEATIEVREQDEAVNVTVHGDQLGLLIGRRGQTLDSLQYLVNLVANKDALKPTRFVVDIEGYRERREETLRHLAVRLASKVKARRHRAVLEPMTPQERRIIHLALQDDSEVTTYSEGAEPYRRVVIALKEYREREDTGGGVGFRS